MSVKLPNFLIIGAAKSGTTALFRYLEQHPQVFISEPKEPHFLALEGKPLEFRGPGDDQMMNMRAITDFARWEKLFAGANGAKAIGEGSVSTLYYSDSVPRIQKYLPDVKLICLLRQPAERAFSAFSFMHTRVYEPFQDFAEALRQEDQRIAEGWHHIWHYRQMGFYYRQLKPFFDAFGRDRMKVYLFDEFRKNPQATLRDCFEFLEIDPTFVPAEEPAPHISGMPRSRLLQTVVTRARTLRQLLKLVLPRRIRNSLKQKFERMNLQRESLDPEIWADLTASYKDDILQLQDFLGRDLSHWLKPREKSRQK